jgi:hypothetical protein
MRKFRLRVAACAAMLLVDVTGMAQSRLPGEAGRGFPYTSEEWTWGPWVFVLVLILTIAIAAAVKDRLKDQPWWHTLLVVGATLLSSVALTVRVSQPYRAEIGLMMFMLIPSVVGIGILYLTIVSLVQGKRDKNQRL